MIGFLRGLGRFAAGRWERFLDAFHGWRWGRAESERSNELATYRLPIQICPRGCESHETARRDLLTRTAFWGRVETRVVAAFETSNCPKCGAELVDRCARCKEEIYAPVVDRCQFCGLPQPWAAARRVAAERASVRKWRPPKEEGVTDTAHLLYDAGQGRELWVIDGDITHLEVDAVISSVDVDGQMWSEVASAIRAAAGEEVEQRAQDGKPYKLGKAWFTTAGDMASTLKGIIHVASMNRRGESNLELVRKCLREAMRVAADQKYESVGIGTFGSGTSAIRRSDWLETFIDTMIPLLAEPAPPGGRGGPLAILLVLFEPEDFPATYRFLLENVVKEHEKLGRPAGAKPGSSLLLDAI